MAYNIKLQHIVIIYLSFSSLLRLAAMAILWAMLRMKDVSPLWSSLSLTFVIGLVCICLWLWGRFSKKKFTLVSFSYKDAIESWKSENKWYDDSQIMILATVVSFQIRPNFFFKVSWIFLVSMMLSQFWHSFTTYNLNSWIWQWWWHFLDTWVILVLGFIMQIVAFRLWAFLDPFPWFEFLHFFHVQFFNLWIYFLIAITNYKLYILKIHMFFLYV